jgi:hypothetical protein
VLYVELLQKVWTKAGEQIAALDVEASFRPRLAMRDFKDQIRAWIVAPNVGTDHGQY